MSVTPEQMTLCKWCDRVARRSAVESEGAWIGRKAWEKEAGRPLRPLSHGICPSCIATVLQGLYEAYGRPKGAAEAADAEAAAPAPAPADKTPLAMMASPPGSRHR